MNNMANMAGMGGPVNAPMSMMNNGGLAPQAAQRHGPDGQHRTLLNTYIYEYFIRSGMWECARAVLQADNEINVKKQSPGHSNGLGDDPMDTDSKDLLDKRPDDLPAPNVPMAVTDSCFLFDWFSLFWTMFSHQKGPGHTSQVVNQYVQHTQAQSRVKQEQQRDLLRNMRPDAYNQQQYQQHMLRMQNGAMNMGVKPGNNLQRAAMANNQNPQTMQMLQQNKVAGQMQRDPSDMEGNRVRPGSPASAENAPSPSKRPRLDGGAPFNPQAGVMMPNGRPQGMPGQQQVGNGPDSARALLLQNGINPTQLNPDQLQAFISASPHVQAKSLATYSANLQQHHGNQMPNKPMANAVGPQGQGSPMVPQGPDAPTLNQYYNPNEMGPGGMRPVQGNGQATGGSNHALQDYQMQLMLLEQQNKKRLMMARQEQDLGNTMPRPDGPPGGPPGPNAQGFQQGTSPPGGRSGASPNPEQMKRAQQMNNAANMGGSPLPDGAVQSRSSPNAMNFMDGSNMVPNGGPQFMNMQMNGAGMRPPNSHPNPQFNPQQQLAHQQMMAQRQGQGMQGPGMQWQPGGPNGQLPGQGPPPQIQGTPTQAQRTMGPPSAPNAAANAANSRNATSSPQVSTAAPPTPQAGNKPAPKKKETKNSKAKTAQKKTNNNLNNTAATPAGDENAQEAPTPATPITPSNPASFAKNQNINAGPVVPNGQPAVQQPPPQAPPVAAPQHQDSNLYMDAGALEYPLGFADPTQSNDVLTDFDFDSFLHDGNNGDDGVGNFDFGGTAFGMDDGTNTIGTAD
ncbi:hypothetical protein QBC36DRAFT_190575 [Triangularia setosa]|uniref:LisH domain-containing protein n=1 Tax=Triangularia setosa TaxID=2587417 RepID=A0AAN7A6H8_9PEZI|nr:hypothetical protein QBC36DRAFT_190575 [Podospora setosa]